MRPSRPLLAPLLALLLLPLPSQAYAPLSLPSLRTLARALSPATDASFALPGGHVLAPLLHPRVPGTPGSAAARRHVVGFFEKHLPLWTVELHRSTQATPGGRVVEFVNVIARRDLPPGGAVAASKEDGHVERLTLAAHYDTLSTIEGFVGAIDSAAPCAVLMRVAQVLEPALQRMWAAGGGAGGAVDDDDYDGLEPARGLQIVFFDGEEAFGKWSDEDSLYGSR
jgi:hypothetical protein